ncbi:bestrophin-like domain [Streptomyces jumonjinensis]|uniref:bestrophin-like domain n=1 Tax=Streptomyces jumonjinensis TaxID=1945 RepID=UPI00379E1026
MSEWLILSIAMVAACAVVLAVTLLSQRRRAARAEGAEPHQAQTPEVLEYMTMMIGVIYAIVLGLAIAGVWEARSAAQDDVRREAQALHEITQRAEVYPRAVQETLREDIESYVSYVLREEWPRMVKGEALPSRGAELIDKLREDIAERAPAGDLEAQAYQPMLERVAITDDARNERAQNAGATLPAVVWFGLIIGALITVGLIFTMRLGRSTRELVVAGLFSALIAFLLFLVWDFDAPFGRAGAGTDTAEAFRQLFPGATQGL